MESEDLGIGEIAAIIVAAAAVAGTAYTISQGQPEQPDFRKLVQRPAPPMKPALPPPTAPNTDFVTEEQKARQRAAQRMKEIQTRAEAPSTALSAPLGISAPSSTVTSTALGR